VKIEPHDITSAAAEASHAKAEARLLLVENGALRERIAELEAALHDMAKHVWRGDWNQLKPETRALLGEKK